MIQAQFYDDYATIGSTLITTDSVGSLNITDPSQDPAHAYYMGKLSPEDFPSCVPKKFFSTITPGDNADSWVGLKKTDRKINWGYAFRNAGSGYYRGSNYYWDDNQLKYQGNFRFLNSLEAYKHSAWGSISLRFKYYEMTQPEGSDFYAGIHTYSDAVDLTVQEFIDWCTGQSTITLTFNEEDHELEIDDFDEYGIHQVYGNSEVITMTGAAVDLGGKYYGSNDTAYVFPFFGTYLDENYYGRALHNQALDDPPVIIYTSSNFSEITCNWRDGYQTFDYEGGVHLINPLIRPFKVNFDFLHYAKQNPGRIVACLDGDHLIIGHERTTTSSGGRYFGLEPIVSPHEFWAAYCLFNKINLTGSGTTEYYTTNSNVALFTTSNMPKIERETYTEPRETFERKLRDWQKDGNNINGDDFVPESDVPPGPDDDWDPDTEPEEDPNDYEINPISQLNPPLFGSVGPRFWAMSIDEFKSIYNSIKDIMNAYIDYYDTLSNDPLIVAGKALGLSINKDLTFQKYSGFAGNSINDAIASVMWFPFDLNNIFATETAAFTWGLTSDTEFVSYTPGEGAPPVIATQFKKEIIGYWGVGHFLVRGGHCTYFKHYKNFIDYKPYCDAILYVPYCGTVHIDPQKFVGHDLNLEYIVDFISGACLGLIMRDSLIVDTIPGQMGVQIPVSMANYGQYIDQIIGANAQATNAKIGLVGSAVAGITGGAKIVADIATEAGMSGISGAAKVIGHNANNLVGIGSNTLSSINSLMTAQYQLESAHMTMTPMTTGSPVISTGNEQKARLVLYQPRWLEGYGNGSYGKYGHTTGFATLENKQLLFFTGLTVAESIDTSGITQATEKEKEMISKAFKGGVYL